MPLFNKGIGLEELQIDTAERKHSCIYLATYSLIQPGVQDMSIIICAFKISVDQY